MEFLHYLLGGMLDLIILIIMVPLMPVVRIINSKRLNAFVEEVFKELFSEEGLF